MNNSVPTKSLAIHFFTIVLNGMPFIEYHLNVFSKLPFKWHWHIIEGVADLKNCTAWSVQNGARITDEIHNKGLSNDGTTEYIDLIKAKYPENIDVYRKENGAFWNGKLEMVSAPLVNITEECILWQIDSDELWTVNQINVCRDLYRVDQQKTASYYFCNFFVGERLFITSVNTYGNNTSYEWLRSWRYVPGDKWISHEPPALHRKIGVGKTVDIAKINPFNHYDTLKAGLVFQHFAYAIPEQLLFKEKYYGYNNALNQWQVLQQQFFFPVKLKDYFAWVKDESVVDKIDNFNLMPLAKIIQDKWQFNYDLPQKNKLKILWTRTDSIGDNILSIGMLKYLYEFYNEPEIYVVCQIPSFELYENNPYVRSVITIPWKIEWSDDNERLNFYNKIKLINPDMMINPIFTEHHTADLPGLDFIKIRIAFRNNKQITYTNFVPYKKQECNELHRNKEFMEGLGINLFKQEIVPEINYDQADLNYAEAVFSDNGYKKEKTIVFLGGTQAKLKEYLNYFEDLPEFIVNHNFTIIALGAKEDYETNQKNLDKLNSPFLNLCGKTSLKQAAAIIKLALFVYGADTSLAHIACAVGTPSLILMSGAHFGRFLPYSNLTNSVVLPLNCFGCDWHCNQNYVKCVKDIQSTFIAKSFIDSIERSSAKKRIYLHPSDTKMKEKFLNNLYVTDYELVDFETIDMLKTNEDLDSLNLQAKDLSDAGKISEAIDLFEQALVVEPMYFKANFNLGVLYYKQKELKKSAKCYLKCLEIMPNDRNSTINCYYVLKELGNNNEAEKIIATYLIDNYDDSDMQNLFKSSLISDNNNNLLTEKMQTTTNEVNMKSEHKINKSFISTSKKYWECEDIYKAMFERIIIVPALDNKPLEEKIEAWNHSAEGSANQILNDIPYNSNWKALEIGCGIGRVIKPLRQKMASVDGVDIAENMIVFAKEYLADCADKGNVWTNNGYDIAFLESNSYDLVYSIIVFQHIRSVSVVNNYLKEIKRVLKPGGYFKIQVFDNTKPQRGKFNEEAMDGIDYGLMGNGYSPDEFKLMLSNHNFDILKISHSSPWLWGTCQKPLQEINESDNYLVSAIVSTYNSEKYIKYCMDDLINQTLYQKGLLEIVIVNSASEQNEEAIINEYRTKYKHIKYLKTEKRETLYKAWNIAIQSASGKYITNANTDDGHRYDALEVMVNELEQNKEIDLVYAHSKISNFENIAYDDCVDSEILTNSEFDPTEALLHFQFGPHPMWRKSVHAKIGFFNEEFTAVGDYDFNIRFAMKCKAKLINQVLGIYYRNPNSITFSSSRQGEEKVALLTAYRVESVLLELYKNAGWLVGCSEQKRVIFVDQANKALSYHRPGISQKGTDVSYAALCSYQSAKYGEQLFLRERKKLAFIVQNNNVSFLKDIFKHFQDKYIVKLVDSSKNDEIANAYNWADVLWLEWVDILAVNITKLPKKCRIICRLHAYEAFLPYLNQINWANVDEVIFLAKNVKDYVEKKIPEISSLTKTVQISGGLDLSKFKFVQRNHGYNIAFVASLIQTKNLSLLLQTFNYILKNVDPRFQLHIFGDYERDAGAISAEIPKAYTEHIIAELGISDKIKFYGFVSNDQFNKSMENMNYIISTSYREGLTYNISEAMAMGIMPIIHNWPGAKSNYQEEHVFTYFEEVKTFFSKQYNSTEYRRYVEENHDLSKALSCMEKIVSGTEICEYGFGVHNNLPEKLNKEAKALAIAGNIDAAIAKFEDIANNYQDYFDPNFNLGVLYQQKDNKQAAIEYYCKCLKIKKNDRNCVINLTYLFLDLSQFAEAEKIMTEFMAEFQDDQEMRNLLEKIKSDAKLCNSLNLTTSSISTDLNDSGIINTAYLIYGEDITSSGIIKNQVIPLLKDLSDKKNVKITIISLIFTSFNYKIEKLELLKEELIKFGIEIVVIRIREQQLILNDLEKIIMQKNIKLLHCRSYLMSEFAMHIKKKLFIPYIFDVRGLMPEEQRIFNDEKRGYKIPESQDNLFLKLKGIECKLMDTADSVVALNKSFADDLKTKYNSSSDRIDEINNFVDIGKFAFSQNSRELVREKMGWNEKVVFVYSGSFSPWYDFELAVKWLAEIRNSGIDGLFLILSYTDDSINLNLNQKKNNDYFNSIIKDLINKYDVNGEIHDCISGELFVFQNAESHEVSAWLSAADIAVIPHKTLYREILSVAQPIKLAEYIANGLPVLCNDVNNEIINCISTYANCGWILKDGQFNKYDIEKIKEFIKNTKNNTQQDHRKSISQVAVNHYNLNDVTEKYWNLYDRLFKKKNLKYDYVKIKTEALIDNSSIMKINPSRKIKIAVFPNDLRKDGCSHYRILSPFGALPENIEILWVENFNKDGYKYAKQYAEKADIIVVQRFFPSPDTVKFMDYLFALNKPIVYELDDLLTEVPQTNPSYGWSNIRKPHMLDVAKRASAITVTTPRLKTHFVNLNSNIFVLPNLLSDSLWTNSVHHHNSFIVIAYAGTLTHAADLRIIEQTLVMVSEKYQNKIAFIFMGCKTEALERLPNFNFIPPEKDYNTYTQALQALPIDIMLVPLDDNEFNNCKSNIKWLEYSACEIPCIFSNLEPYNSFVKDHETGLLVNNDTLSWYNAICEMIDKPELRRQIASNAKNEVLQKHTINSGAHLWLDLYTSLINSNKEKVNSDLQIIENKVVTINVISFNAGSDIPSSQYLRQVAPLVLLEKNCFFKLIDGWQFVVKMQGKSVFDYLKVPENSILFLQRDFSGVEFVLDSPLKVIYEIDDNLMGLPVGHPDYQTYLPLANLLKKYLPKFDLITTSTDILKDELLRYNSNVVVIPNYLPFVPSNKHREKTYKVKILISGTKSHLADIMFLVPVIKTIALKYSDRVDFIIWGFFPEALKEIPNIHFMNIFIKDYRDYLNALCSLNADIGLVPLLDTEFNNYKSDIKWKEYSACKMATIASDVLSYKSIENRQTGILLSNQAEIWQNWVEELINNSQLREAISENAFQHVITRALLGNNIGQWENALRHEIKGSANKSKNNSTCEISIIIPVYNHFELTKQCLDNLLSLPTATGYELIIVDNNSSDETQKYFSCNTSGKILYYRNNSNLGFAKACNLGAEKARGKYLVFLNNDTIPLTGWLDNLYKAYTSDAINGIVGCKLLYQNNTIQHCGVSMHFDNNSFRHQYKFLPSDHSLVNKSRKCDAVTAACFMISKTIFEQCGMFDEVYLNGCEDIDLCNKVRQAGYQVYYCAESALYHLESQTPREKPQDAENFKKYLAKWGKSAIKNEIEIYTDDGLWQNNKDVYTPVHNNQLVVDFLAKYRDYEEKHNQSNAIYGEILARIYPVDKWQKPISINNSLQIVQAVKENSSVKALFVCHDFPPYKYAGAQLYAYYLALALTKNSCQVDIFYPVAQSARKDEAEKELYSVCCKEFNGLRVYEITIPDQNENLYQAFYNPQIEQAFRELLLKEKYQIVHYHLLHRLSATLPLISQELKIKSVATLHDYWLLCIRGHMIDNNFTECSGPATYEKCSKCQFGEIKPEFLEYFQTRIKLTKAGYVAIDHKISPSGFLADVHSDYGFVKPQVLPLGWLTYPVQQRIANPAKIVFGYLGQVVSRKGLDILLQAVRIIELNNWQLKIYGEIYEPWYYEKIKPIIENHPNISYHGGYDNSAMSQIFDEIDVFIMPSRRENYPLTLIEALSAKIPAVASDVGGVREMMTDGKEGFIFKNGDVMQLKSILENILSQPQLIAQMKNSIGSLKTIEDNASEMYNVYHNLLKQKKVVFACIRELHLPVLLPICEQLKNLRPDLQIGFMAPNYRESKDGIPQEGLSIASLELLNSKNIEFWGWNKSGEKFDCVVCADVCYWYVDGWGPIVNVGHGTISKGVYFTSEKIARRENFADILCVPGEWYKNCYGEQVITNIAVTGFAKMDELAKTDIESIKKENFARAGFSVDKTTILYAPTFNIELTSMIILAEAWQKLPEQYQVYVKLHGACEEDLKKYYRKLCQLLPKLLYYVEDADIADFMLISDLMISDVSSVALEYLVLNKPIILVDNPDMSKYSKYNPVNVEFLFRDCAYCVKNENEMFAALAKLQTSDSLHDQRDLAKKRLFGELDGNNSLRIADQIQNLLNGTPKLNGLIQRFSVYVPASAQMSSVRENLLRAKVAPVVYVDRYQTEFKQWKQIVVAENQLPGKELVVLTGEHLMPYEWDNLLSLVLVWQSDYDLLAPLFDQNCTSAQQKFSNYRASSHDITQMPYNLLYQGFTKFQEDFYDVAEVDELLMDGLVLNLKLDNLSVNLISDQLINRNLKKGVLTGFYAYSI